MLELIFNSEREELTEAGFYLIFVGIPLLAIFLAVFMMRGVNKKAFLKVNKKVLSRVKKMAKKIEPRYQEMLEGGRVLSFSCYRVSWFILFQTTEVGCLLKVNEDDSLMLYPLVGRGIHSFDEPLLLTYNDIEKESCQLEDGILTLKLKEDKLPYKIMKNSYTQDEVYRTFLAKLGLRS